MRLGGLALWVLAVVVTVGAALWQRTSGPTYPVRATIDIAGTTTRARLVRSGETGEPLAVVLRGLPPGVAGEVAWRRFPTAEPWTVTPLQRGEDGYLRVDLPSQPPAGKLEYQVRLHGPDGQVITVPERPAVARFKGGVSPAVLIPHILAMFTGMLLSTRAGLGAWLGGRRGRGLAVAALVLLGVGGLLLGPLVQKAAFGAFWTGWPFGGDLTDNKTAVAVAAWAWAVWRTRGGRGGRGAVIVAAAVTLVVFAIPHSTWGSELQWHTLPAAPTPSP